MTRIRALGAGVMVGLWVGVVVGLMDQGLRALYPGLASGRSAVFAALMLYGIAVGACGLFLSLIQPRRTSSWVLAILLPLGLLVVIGGAVNILWLPSLFSPLSLAFDLLAVLACLLLSRLLLRSKIRPPLVVAGVSSLLLLALSATLSWFPDTGWRPANDVAAPEGAPNILVVLFDALRADHLSLYGYERATTPHVDAFARDAAVFMDVQAPSSWTKPSVATLFTGTDPASHGNHLISSRLPDELITLPELLTAAGYRCGVFAENAFVSPLFGYDRGVDLIAANEPDVVAQTIAGHLLQQLEVRVSAFSPLLALSRRVNVLDPRQRGKQHGELDVIAAYRGWIQDADDRPTFAYVHLMKPHAPYTAPSPFDGSFGAPDVEGEVDPPHMEGLGPFAKTEPWDDARRTRLIANYDERLLYGDHMFSQILAATPKLSDTAVLIIADHGEDLGENGIYDHGHSLQEGVVRVPFVLRPAGGLSEQRRVEARVRLLDFAPTVLEMAAVGPAGQFAGASVLPLLETQEATPRPVLLQLRHGPAYEMDAWIRGSQKLVRTVQGSERALEHFDLRYDPRESAALGASALRDSLEAEMAAAIVDAGRYSSASAEVMLDEATMERLRAVGYVQ